MIMHLPPRQDPSILLKKLDEEYVRRNPIVREEVLGELAANEQCTVNGSAVNRSRQSTDTKPSIGTKQPIDLKRSIDTKQSTNARQPIDRKRSIDTKQSTNTRQPIDTKQSTDTIPNHPPKRIRIAEDSPATPLSYASDEEMNALPQMKKVGMVTTVSCSMQKANPTEFSSSAISPNPLPVKSWSLFVPRFTSITPCLRSLPDV